ncbi:MAG TPA: GMC oxidoreductase [Polyangiales bacterium]|nr:GMC oxidoreductase [Polyangiales bacterium]
MASLVLAPRLSLPLCELESHYDVVIIGSGYGGSIAAATLARARDPHGRKLSVCLLERGAERVTGDYPRSLRAACAELQVSAAGKQHGAEDALYWLHAGSGFSVVHGCGLGGTSLIDAGVSLRPDPRVWNDARWPSELRDDVAHELERGFERAALKLRATPYPKQPALRKDEAFARLAQALGESEAPSAPPLNVSFEANEQQAACNGCGDCVAGCNVGAKNTLAVTYLPEARAHGAQIFCGVDVRAIEVATSGEGYRVYYRALNHAREEFGGGELFVSASRVVLAAGVLGSCEILLRSRQRGLPCSERVGRGVSGNGDLLAFSCDEARDVGALGVGDDASVLEAERPGPCISAVIDRRADRELASGHVVQNGVIPAPLAPLLPGLLSVSAAFAHGSGDAEHSSERSVSTGALWRGALRNAARLARGPSEALQRMQTLLVMSHDEGAGRVQLDGDGERGRVSWPNAERGTSQAVSTSSTPAAAIHAELRAASERSGARYVPALDHRITVHPLGGCSMASDAASGVTNHKGQVFSGVAGNAAHAGLYVIDGSVVPCSIGVNPHLTIAAIAERNVQLLARDAGWKLDGVQQASSLLQARPRREPPRELRVQFTERITGRCRVRGVDSACELVVTVSTEDCRRMIEDPEHAARIVGSARIPALSSEPLTVANGRFNLFTDASAVGYEKYMSYCMQLASVEGGRYYLDGHKHLGGPQRLRARELWRETTTLFITLHEGDDASAPRIGEGVARVSAGWFAKELLHMRAMDRRGKPSLRGLALYGGLFASGLWQIYGPPSGLRVLQPSSGARPGQGRARSS